jgi:4-hydroxy-tetrahydrodipicolinate synthase
MKNMNLKGAVTALITPFINQALDENGLVHNINHQLANGINGILVLGTTGEASTLSPEEKTRIITLAVKHAKGKVPVWVGTGLYCTRQTIEATKRAKDLGADVALIVTPYYNKPTQEGIFRHFEAITQQVDIPIVVYNIQGRCGVNIETQTLKRIAGLPNIIGVKEASGNISQVEDVLRTVVSQYPDFLVYSGDDALTLPMMSLGAIGVISVVSNLVPAQVTELVSSASKGRFDLAKEMHFQLLPLFKSAFIETNPVPIKTAMGLCGMPSGDCRLPLYKMETKNLDILHQSLKQMQLV